MEEIRSGGEIDVSRNKREEKNEVKLLVMRIIVGFRAASLLVQFQRQLMGEGVRFHASESAVVISGWWCVSRT